MAIDVLVVDEEEDVLDVTATFLGRQDGLAVSTETDAERALERVLDGEIQAVVSDLSMPKLDGLELCLRLREAGSDVPFVLFTGRREGDVPDANGKEYVTGFVQKGTGVDQYEAIAEHVRDGVS